MKFNVLHNFISPVTGRILSDYKYVLVGNRQGIAIPSPILIDIRLDLIALRKRYDTLVQADLIVGHPNYEIPNGQVLVNLPNGFLYNTAGTVSILPTPLRLPLCYAATTEPLSVTYNNGAAGVGATLTEFPFGTFTIDGLTPPLNSIILVKDQSSAFQNGIYVLTDTGSIATSWVLTRIDTYDQAGEIQPGDIVAVQYGTVNAQTLWVQTENVSVVGTDDISFFLLSPLSVLPEGKIWIGDNMNHPVPQPIIALTNLPDLTFKAIWRGDITGRPAESQDLTILEGQVLLIENKLVTIQGQIAALETQVAANTADILLINGELLLINGALILLQAQVAANAANILILLNRTLNEIPLATGDVNINNHRLINVSDPIDPLDAANKQYVDASIGDINDATYIIQTADLSLPNAQILADLSSGIVKNTTTTGVLSIATPGTDYYSPGNPTTIIDDFNLNGNPLAAYGNNALGTLALNSLTLANNTNTYNVAIGFEALYQFTTGYNNTAVGMAALFSLVSGSDNIGIGFYTAAAMTSGNQNSIIGGYPTFGNVVSGSSRNSILGFAAGQNQTTYNSCVFLGANADASVNNLTNAIAIGDGAQVGANNTCVIGHSGTAMNLIINGVAGAGAGTINAIWNGTVIDLAHGGTNAALTASNGGMVYSTASALAILAGTAIANQPLFSGASGAPSWSNTTYPNSILPGQLLYGSGVNAISPLANAPNATLMSNGSGIPSWQTTLPILLLLSLVRQIEFQSVDQREL